MNNKQKETVVFYHLPKTAGTTINTILKQNYSADETVMAGADSHGFVNDFGTWSEEKYRKINLLQGHFPYGIHDLLPQPSRYFTIVRHPVERTISYYYHAVRDPHHYLYELIHTEKMPLKALLDSGQSLMMNDGQTRLLSAVWGEVPVGGVNDEMLNTAISNLEAMTIVGLTERFDESLLLLQQAFGWQNISYTRQNIGTNYKKNVTPDAETLAAIMKYNQQDMQLYGVAERLFKTQLQEYGSLFPIKLAAFKRRQKYQPFFLRQYVKLQGIHQRIRKLL